MARMGRPTIFSPKQIRIQGVVSPDGGRRFERARRALARLVGWKPAQVSDGDTIEFLARGEEGTAAYLTKQKTT